jgi:predicted nucleotidyltransferase
MLPLIANRRAEIAELCRRYHVRRLDVFGSGARERDFDPDRSDLDFVVEFEAGDEAAPSLKAFFALRQELESALGRPVDLVTAGTVRNPYRRAGIDSAREAVYAA